MSEASTKAAAFVAAHRAQAQAVGLELAELVGEPESFVDTLVAGLAALGDPAYTRLTARVSPGIAPDLEVRSSLLAVVQGELRPALIESSSITVLQLAQRLIAAPQRSVRLFALPCLERGLAEDPEQSWQLMRRMAHGAGDWIEVDTLAEVWARGILAEDFRWAELEQLVYSEHTFERRMVGAALASMPHQLPSRERGALLAPVVDRVLELLRQLMGDAEPMVQKSISWALRNWTSLDPDAVEGFLGRESQIAVRQRDGARAWVVRDALSKQPADLAARLRADLAGIRRDPHAASTSISANQAADFAALLTTSHDAVAAQGDRYTRSRA
jgi:3-methyladenine DNA glycosylase AlkD